MSVIQHISLKTLLKDDSYKSSKVVQQHYKLLKLLHKRAVKESVKSGNSMAEGGWDENLADEMGYEYAAERYFEILVEAIDEKIKEDKDGEKNN